MICVLSYQNHVGLCKPQVLSIARGIRIRKTVLREPKFYFAQRCGGLVTSSKPRGIRLRAVEATPLVNDPLGIRAVSETISLLSVRMPCTQHVPADERGPGRSRLISQAWPSTTPTDCCWCWSVRCLQATRRLRASLHVPENRLWISG